jgi:hypothetical protein
MVNFVAPRPDAPLHPSGHGASVFRRAESEIMRNSKGGMNRVVEGEESNVTASAPCVPVLDSFPELVVQ